MNLDGFTNQAVDMVFYPRNLGELLLRRHVVVNESKAAIQCQGDRHPRFGDGVHVRRNNRQVERKAGRYQGFEVRLARHDLAVKRGEGHIVVGEGNSGVRLKKIIRWTIEGGIKIP